VSTLHAQSGNTSTTQATADLRRGERRALPQEQGTMRACWILAALSQQATPHQSTLSKACSLKSPSPPPEAHLSLRRCLCVQHINRSSAMPWSGAPGLHAASMPLQSMGARSAGGAAALVAQGKGHCACCARKGTHIRAAACAHRRFQTQHARSRFQSHGLPVMRPMMSRKPKN